MQPCLKMLKFKILLSIMSHTWSIENKSGGLGKRLISETRTEVHLATCGRTLSCSFQFSCHVLKTTDMLSLWWSRSDLWRPIILRDERSIVLRTHPVSLVLCVYCSWNHASQHLATVPSLLCIRSVISRKQSPASRNSKIGPLSWQKCARLSTLSIVNNI